MSRFLALFIGILSLCALSCDKSNQSASKPIKIGFVVKQPEEPWFQNEWKFAQQAADKYGFTLVKIGAPDGEKALAAIDNLAAQGASGLIICTPDVHMGPAIVARTRGHSMKLFSVDDQFVDAKGKALDVHHMGISAYEIGQTMGKALHAEMTKRGWTPQDTGVCAVTFEELDTARQRTDGAMAALMAAGFPKDRIYKTPQRTSDVPGAMDAANTLLTQHGDVKKWLILGMNDATVLGAVRATEGRGLKADDVIGVGIGGDTGLTDFKKEKPTGFFATVLISPKRHGYETAELMYKWIKDGVEPPKTTFTAGILMTRETYQGILKEQGF